MRDGHQAIGVFRWVVAGCVAISLAAAQEPGAVSPPSVWVVPVRGEINDLMRDFIKRNLDEAAAAGARAVVLDMHTPGGLVGSALDISAALKASKLRTVVWVHTDAISAGAMISLACTEIVVADHASIGDCAPIMVGPQGVVDVGEAYQAKIESRILAEFRDSAVSRGYPEALCVAMVRLGPAVYRVAHVQSGRVEYVDASGLRGYGLLDPDKPTDPSAAPAENQGWKIEKKVVGDRELLTLIAEEAMEYGFAKARVADESELADYLGVKTEELTRSEMNVSERVVGFLTSPLVRGLLILVLVLSFYAEMQAPGLGVMGAVAVACLVVLLGAPYLTGMTNLLEICVIVIGFALIAVEIFLIPGFGVAGVAGVLLVIAGLVLTFVPPEPGPGILPTLQGTWDAALTGLTVVVLSLCLGVVGAMLLTRYFGAVPFLRRLEVAPPDAASLAPASWVEGHASLKAGDVGRVAAMLRPVGRAEFDGVLVDVVTRGEMVPAGKDVRVVEVHGNRVVVEAV